MKTIINTTKSKIRIKRSTLQNNSAHAEVELWGVIPEGFLPPTMRPKLLNFGESARHPGMVFLSYNTPPATTDYITLEDFSKLIWNLPIIDNDGNEISTDIANIIYEQLVRTKKMFTTINGLPF